MTKPWPMLLVAAVFGGAVLIPVIASAQSGSRYDNSSSAGSQADPYSPNTRYARPSPPAAQPAPNPRTYRQAPPRRTYNDAYRPPARTYSERYPSASSPDSGYRAPSTYRDDRGGTTPPYRSPADQTYSQNEIVDAGHKFFGSVSSALARAVAHLFRKAGRPNGYILGEDAAGAFVAGLRYGEGRLYTKYDGSRRIYWQGPTIGYDFGGEGSRTMILVYNMRRPSSMLRRFGGVEGSAYVVGGVSVQLMKNNDITIAPIRSGVGLRLGANIGYLKFTRRPTWNPF